MKIGLIGYGKMGKAIERIAVNRGHEIVFKSDSKNPLATIDLNNAEVAIEFTQPDLAVDHIHFCLNHELPVVVGTTAWQTLHLTDVTENVNEKNGALLHASNFSVGVNILFQLNEVLARLMGNQPSYQLEIQEIHHLQKLDSPSGTAVTLAEGIIENNKLFSTWKSAEGKLPVVSSTEIPIEALREPEVPGTHSIKYSSDIDTINLTHIAHNREGFALGSVLAAEFLVNRKGCFTMRDVLAL